MPKYYCDYCDVFLTHDSTSVRKAHNAGRNHLQNVKDYYAGLGHDKAQSIIDEIVRVYERGGPPGPVGTMFAGALAQGGPSGLPSAPTPAPAAPPMPAMPPSSMSMMPPPSGMPLPPSGMPQPPPPSSMGMPMRGPPAPNQPLGLPPLPEAAAGAAGTPPTDGPKINPQRAAALGLT